MISRVQRFVTADEILDADIVLCWKNQTRIELNHLSPWLPIMVMRCHVAYQIGEPVMCTYNDYSRGIMNGGIYPLAEQHIAGKRLSMSSERSRRRGRGFPPGSRISKCPRQDMTIATIFEANQSSFVQPTPPRPIK